MKTNKIFHLAILIILFITNSPEVHGASGCNYPTSLDSYTNKVTGDFLTTADINSRSCAIEQLEVAQRQILVTGKTGGNTLIGGSAASESLTLRSTANATKGGIFLDATSATLFSTAAAGPRFSIDHQTSTNDIGGMSFIIRDASNTSRISTSIIGWYLDSTTNSQDSEIQFCVQNNVNAGNCATVARLSSLGLWTNASSAVNKEYEGDIPGGTINKLKQLTTIGVYRAKDLPPGKIKNATRHYSPTAEDFHKVFGFGTDTGIAASDAAFIAARAVLELEARVQALEKAK